MYRRQTLCLQVVAMSLLWSATPCVTSARVAGRRPFTGSQEITVYDGVGPGATTDLTAFFVQADVAFVGTFDHATVEFVDAASTQLATRMFFKPTTVIKGTISTTSSGTFAVAAAGGSYVKTAAGPRPFRPIVEAERLSFGAAYFVAADQLHVPGSPVDGQYRLMGPETLVRINGAQVSPVSVHSAWFDAVMTQGRAMAVPATAGATVDDATAFLAAMRHGAGQPR